MSRHTRRAPARPTRATSRVSRGIPNPQIITHGKQINEFNTGYTAWYDATFGRNLAIGDLTMQGGTHYISDFFSGGSAGSPTIVYGYHFPGDIAVDVNYITFRGCVFDNPVTTKVSGVEHYGVSFDYCTAITATVGPWAAGESGYSATRSHFGGSSDGIRAKGGGVTDQVITECYIQTTMANNLDHNDAMQNDGGNGVVKFIRCNLDAYPVSGILPGSGTNGPDACFFASEFSSSSVFRGEVTDCLLRGGAEMIRFYDGALTTNITYSGTGNRFVRTDGSDPVGRGSANITPTGQITWSNNVWDDDGSSISLI